MNEPKSPDETDLRAERDRLRAELEERQKADAGKKLANEVALMRLESRFTKELGARGVHFDIVDATHLDEGFIVVGLGPSVLHKPLRHRDKAGLALWAPAGLLGATQPSDSENTHPREPQTRSSRSPGACLIDSVKAIENVGLSNLGNADARISNRYLGMSVLSHKRD